MSVAMIHAHCAAGSADLRSMIWSWTATHSTYIDKRVYIRITIRPHPGTDVVQKSAVAVMCGILCAKKIWKIGNLILPLYMSLGF